MAKFALDKITEKHVTLHLFQKVENMPEVRMKLMAGQLQCCLINPKLIVDPFQVIVAANKATISPNRTTKTVFTEILFNLSISKNITKSLLQFGVGDTHKEVLLLTIDLSNDPETDENDVLKQLKGEKVDLKALEQIRDLDLIKKVYKITEAESGVCKLIDSVVSRIATKDFISH